MIKSAFHRSKRLLFALLVAGVFCFASCTVDKTTDVPLPDDWEQSDYVRVSASVRATLASRAYPDDEFGAIQSGKFVLTYPFSQSIVSDDTTYTYNIANVKFGVEGLAEMGFVTYYDQKKKDNVSLKWSEVLVRKAPPKKNTSDPTPPQTAVLYLDNVPADLHNSESQLQGTLNKRQNLVIFYDGDEVAPEQKNPFRAGLYDYETHSNDLLWGSSVAEKNAKIVYFQETKQGDFRLHHNMSRLRVVIDAKERDDNQAVVDFSHEVKLELVGLHHVPLYFDRVTGNLTLKDDPETENSLPLAKFTEEEEHEPNTAPSLDPDDLTQAMIPWKSIEEVEDTDADGKPVEFMRYTSYDFVVPPQELSNDDTRPKLRLTVPAKYVPGQPEGKQEDVVYEANLPQNMYFVKGEGNDQNTSDLPAMPFSFLKEYDMTIKAVVGPPELELRFAPVLVQDWISLGAQEISGNQAGIYTNQDFYDFLECYRTGNLVRLERYGYRNSEDDPWKILFWSSALKLYRQDTETSDGETVTGIDNYLAGVTSEFFKEQPFEFVFNNNVVHLLDDENHSDLSGASGQLRLYAYVTGQTVKYPGIKDADHFLEMIKAYNSKNFKSDLTKFGAYDNTYEQWEIEFLSKEDGGEASGVIELDYKTITKEKMHFFADDTYGGAGNFKFTFRGQTIKVTGIPDLTDPAKMIDIELSGIEGEQILHAIVAYPEGLYSAEDVALLIRAYNSLDPDYTPDTDDVVGDGGDGGDSQGGTSEEPANLSWLLNHFGVPAANDDKWTFRFIKPMELWGPDIYGTMEPNSEKNMPEYDFQAVAFNTKNGNLTADNNMVIKVSDTGSSQYSYSYTNGNFANNLKKLFTKGGVIKTQADLYSKNTTNGTISRPMITYANNGNPIYRRYYGWYDEVNAQWIYPINPEPDKNNDNIRQIEVDYEWIYAQLTSNEPTVFRLLNDSRVLVKMPNGAPALLLRGDQGADLLYRILRGYYTPEDYKPGIELSADFSDLIKAYNASDLVSMQRYGTFDEAQNKWIFKFTETAEKPMTVALSKLQGEMPAKEDMEYAFDFGDHVLTLDLPGNTPSTLNIAGASGAALLHAILTDQHKLTSPADVAWMIQAYNREVTAPTALSLRQSAAAAPAPAYGTTSSFSSVMRTASVPQSAGYAAAPLANEATVEGNFDWILNLYGRSNGNQWTFHYANTMELSLGDIYRKMKPDPEDGKPEYIFEFDFEIVPDVGEGEDPQPAERYVTVVEGSYRAHVGGYLKRLFTGNGEITSADELTRLAAISQENPILWRYFGTTDGTTWTFPINAQASFNVAYNDLFGKFQYVDDNKFTLTLGEGIVVKVTPLPDETYRKIECSGEPGAAVLKSILRGTYSNPAPEIRDEADFQALIEAYNNKPIPEELAIYGEPSGNAWTFHVSAALALEPVDSYYGNMQPGGDKPDYEFTYDDPDGSVTIDGTPVDPVQLRTLLTASGAVNSAGDLLALRADKKVTRYLYGSKNDETPAKWTFPIKTSIPAATETLDWDDINNQFAGTDDLAFTLANGATVKVSNLPGGRTLTCSGQNGATILAQILKGEYVPEKGIMDATEVDALVAAYATGDATALGAYGELSGTWTFTFRSSMELTGEQVYGKMKIEGGSTDYNFVFDSGVTVKVDGHSVTNAELKTLFAASGKITSEEELTAAKPDDDFTRYHYGAKSGTTWEFPIEGLFNLNYKTYNKLFEGENMRISSIDGTVKISNLPGGRTIENCTADDLTLILLGNYTPATGEVKADELPKLIDFYNAFDGSDTSDLGAFGTFDGASWTFKLTAPATLAGEQVYGQMKPGDGKPDYQFEFVGGATVTVDGTPVTNAELKTLFAASGKITSPGDLTAAKEANAVKRHLYGTESGGQWEFPIEGSFDLDYNIYNKLFEGENMRISSINGTVKIFNLPGDRTIENCSEEVLTQILLGNYTPTPGIELSTDIPKLTAAYNDSDPDAMAIYGEPSGSTWTFTFRSSMELTGTEVYGQMKPAPGDGKPDYQFEFAGDATVTVDGTQVNEAQLKTLFAESGSVASADDLTALLADKKVTRYLYGTLSGSTWTFPINTSIANVDWNTVFGKFVGPDTPAFSISDGVTVTLINLPDDRDPLECTGAGGAVDLARILTGAYELEPLPDTGGEENTDPNGGN